MADQIKITFKGDKEAAIAMRQLGDKLPLAAFEAMQKAVLFLKARVVETKLSGQVLKRKTGKLAQSFLQQSRAYRQGKGSLGVIGSNMVYAAIHEFGGTTHPRVTKKMRGWAFYQYQKTKNSMFLGIALTSKKKLDVVIPKRPYLAPTFRENERAVQDIFFRHIKQLADRTVRSS